MSTKASDVLVHYHAANGFVAERDRRSERMPLRGALPIWLGIAAGGWLVIALLFQLLVG